MRTRACLGVELDGENGAIHVPESRHRLIVQVSMGDFSPHSSQGRLIDAEAVVLTRDLDPAGDLVPNWLIRASMPEFQLEGLRTDRMS